MSKALDLFGNMTEMESKNISSPYLRFKNHNRYRLSENTESNCKNCNHCRRMEYHNKNYYKCILMGISHSTATDIKLKNVCDKFMISQD